MCKKQMVYVQHVENDKVIQKKVSKYARKLSSTEIK